MRAASYWRRQGSVEREAGVSTLADLPPAASPGPATAGRRLTICAIGYASSTHVVARVRCFAELGHRVFLITESPSRDGIPGVTELVPAWDDALARRWWFRLCLWGCRKIGGRAVDDAWRVLVFVRLLRRCHPDIVHVHFAYSYYGWLAGLLGCRPLVVTVMGGDVLFDEQGSPTAAGKWLTRELLRKADYITSKSSYLIGVLDRLGGFGDKAERVVWGVSLRRFRRGDASELRTALGLGPERRIVFSPRILQPLYQVHLVVEAIAIVRRRFPEVALLVAEYAADPEYKAAIVRRVDELALADHVIFCGQIEHDAMPAYYSIAEISVGVPTSDGLPQTLLESMACGTPNILSRLPRYEEIVHHRESAYFVTATAAGTAAGISALLDDACLRKKIAENARAIVERECDFDRQARLVEARYQHLAKTIRPRILGLVGLWSTARSYCRHRAAAGRSQGSQTSLGEA
jgi:glycosyltransferase involved in cell wall biosynthesis